MALKVTVNMPEDMEEFQDRLTTALAEIIARKLQPGEFEKFKEVLMRDEITL